MGARKAAILALPLLVSGCVNAPPTAPQVAKAAASTLGLSDTPAPRADDAWWKAFHDPQADRLADKVLAGNPSLQSALARIRAAQAELSVERAASYPQVTLDGQDVRELVSNAYGYLPPYGGSWRWVGDVQAHMTWSLDFWGKQQALIDRARGLSAAAALDAAAARLALGGSFAHTYINLSLAWQNLDIAKETVAERQTILELTQSRVTAGLENEASLEQAKALLATARMQVRRAEAERDMAVHAITALAGEGAGAYADITRPTLALDAALPLPDTLPADLLARRPDILAAQARILAATRGRDAAHANFYPNINLVAAIGFQSLALNNLLSANALTMGTGPAIHLPIFDAGRLRAEYARSTADLDAAVADYNGAVTGAVRQTADALTQVASLADQKGEQQKALDSAARALKLAEERYRLGLSGQIPMLTAESTLLTARQQMAALEADTIAQHVTLLLAVGGDFHPDADKGATP